MTSEATPLPPRTHTPIPATTQRVSRWIARVTGFIGLLVLITAATTAAICALLGIFVVRQRDGFGSWLPLIIAVVTLLVTGVFWYERRLWVKAIREDSRAHRHSSGGNSITVHNASPSSPQESALSPSTILDREEVRWFNARKEYDLRRKTTLPRVEAAQRAATEYLGGVENAPWLERDLRTSVIAFFAMTAGGAICAVTCLVSIIVLASH